MKPSNERHTQMSTNNKQRTEHDTKLIQNKEQVKKGAKTKHICTPIMITTTLSAICYYKSNRAKQINNILHKKKKKTAKLHMPHALVIEKFINVQFISYANISVQVEPQAVAVT